MLKVFEIKEVYKGNLSLDVHIAYVTNRKVVEANTGVIRTDVVDEVNLKSVNNEWNR